MNCIILDDDIVICTLLENYIKKTPGIHIKHVFHSPLQAFESINEFSHIDVLFLDMEMPDMNGIEFLNSLIHIPQIIFISSNKNYAIDAFNYNAIDFLLKPIEYPRFLKSIQKVKDALKEQSAQMKPESDNAYFFKKKNAYYKVLQQDIIWIEAHDNYSKIITCDSVYLTNNTLKSFEDMLPSHMFIRTHRSFIINKRYLNRIEENRLHLEYNGKTSSIPYSKMYKDVIFNSSISFK
ncbi:MAG TPA: LytTR family DNA-binding domain-containing protein [Bacteroidales bacterium]|jgi:DNA-binding LytR/AlgR family response regulator|nr:LytTR family DNA-binding domain-containing protein [Bacteroidales bacterium]